jgi:hypothetical protein
LGVEKTRYQVVGWFYRRDIFICTAGNTMGVPKPLAFMLAIVTKPSDCERLSIWIFPSLLKEMTLTMSYQIGITPSRRAATRFVGQVIRAIQKAFADTPDVSQAEVARRLDVNRSMINRQIRGKI